MVLVNRIICTVVEYFGSGSVGAWVWSQVLGRTPATLLMLAGNTVEEYSRRLICKVYKKDMSSFTYHVRGHYVMIF